MPTYRPKVLKTPDGLEQQFTANIVHVSKGLIALGDLKPEKGKELRFGTPVHSLLVQTGKRELTVELNDQRNQRELSDIALIGLSPTNIAVVYVAGRGPWSGRVSLSPEIEIFETDAHKPKQLGAVRITMAPTPTQLKRMTTMLRSAARDKLVVGRPS